MTLATRQITRLSPVSGSPSTKTALLTVQLGCGRFHRPQAALRGGLWSRAFRRNAFDAGSIRMTSTELGLPLCLSLMLGRLAAIGLLLFSPFTFAAPPGAPINNQAFVSFEGLNNQPGLASSNEVVVRTAVLPTVATLDFLRVSTTGDVTGPVSPAACVAGGSIVPPAQTADISGPFTAANGHNVGEALVLQLIDGDQNRDFTLVESVTVSLQNADTGDSEQLRLIETGADTGIFTGYIATAGAATVVGDCVVQGQSDTLVSATYTDPVDVDDRADASSLGDPIGRAFDSRTGAPVDGAQIQIVDAGTGAPAAVFGVDGISRFPSTIVSGQATTDDSGLSYPFSDGEFRFPNLPAGTYRLVVTAPEGYIAPSVATPEALAALPNAPLRISAASFSTEFTYDGASPLAVDFPLDPRQSLLFVNKTTRSQVAAPGDFVRFEVTVTNEDSLQANEVIVRDTPPVGMRYVDGTLTIDDAAVADPEFDNGDLVIRIPQLAAAARVRIRYVLEVVAGDDGERLRNEAVAEAAGGLESNLSAATVLIREDLLRSRGHLLGRVTEGACGAGALDEDRGIPGVRIYLEDGRYAVTDDGGRFHFEGLEPGTHVAQIDPETVPGHYDVIGCNDNPRYLGRADSQLVDLTAGSLRRADFYLARRQPARGNVTLAMRTADGGSADRVRYSLDIAGEGDVQLAGVKANVLLPDGVAYVPGTARANSLVVDPRVMDQALTFDLDDASGDWHSTIGFDADIDADVSGELVSRAIVSFTGADGARAKTPVAETLIRREAATFENAGYVLGLEFDVLSAELAAGDRAELDRLVSAWQGVQDIRITAVGHSDNTCISPRSREIFADNYILSRARASSAARYLADSLGVAEEDLAIEGRGPSEPVASNDSPEGRQQNRRVELVLAGRRPGKQSFVVVEQESSGVKEMDTRGVIPGSGEQAVRDDEAAEMEAHLEPPTQSDLPLDVVQPGLGFILPEEGFRPPLPAIRISIRHGPDQSIALFLNGLEVDPANFAGRETDTERGVAVSRWAGVELLEGTNRIVADIIAADGRVADRLTRGIHYAGPAVRAELLPEASRLVADGRVRPRVALQLIDRFGEPARHSGVGAFRVDAPYRSWWEVRNDRENQLVQLGSREPLYTIGDDGIAYIDLEPTTQSGEATLRLQFANDVEQEITAWLEPQARDWILVGFGEGSVGYSTLSRNAVGLDAAPDGYYEDGRLAFFAKGRVPGDFLLTLAYDSAKRSQDQREFREEVDPDRWYTLYADATEQRFEAPSQRRLYIKIERRQFNAMFGDFSTGLTASELTRYERRLNGFKSEYAGRHIGYSAFASDTDQGLVRDEIQGDGTSGLYQLSQAPLIAQSETIRLETRDQFDQAEVLETRRLTRFLDYDLDPFTGQIFFKQPVPSRDSAFNPIIIVAEYEVEGSGQDITAGGRVALRSADRGIELGVTHIDEQRAIDPAEVTGADLTVRIGENTLLEAEYASSRRGAGGGSANAGLVSVEHRSERVDWKASYRDVDQDYGLGQQSAAEKGVRRLALDGRMQLNGRVLLRGATSLSDNKETGAERATVETALEYRGERSSALAGVTWAEDRFADIGGTDRRESTIFDAGFSRRLFDSAMTLRANGSFALGGQPESIENLSSYIVGMDYEVLPETELFVEYEDADGRDFSAQMTRAGVRSSPWSRAQIQSSLTNEMSEFGPRVFANLGLVQGFQINERWMLDLGVDQSRTIRGANARQFDDAREPAVGSNTGDYIATYLGSLFQAGDWSMNSRVEFRKSDIERRVSLLSGWYREPRVGHGLSASVAVFHSERDVGIDSTAGEISLGWALRRAESPWSLLYRADLRHEALQAQDSQDRSWRIVSNLNANRRIGAASEIALQHGIKYVRSRFDDVVLDGVTDLYGADWRHALKDRWQIGVQASVLHSWQSGTFDYGSGVTLGYNLADDMWLNLGYNLVGFYDEDFANARYTASGPFLRLTLRAHQSWLRQVARQ